MDQTELFGLFQRTGAVKEGHFRLSSGRHSSRYFQMALLLQYPDLAAKVAAALGEKCAHLGATVVAGPALGGIVLAQEVGRALGTRAIFGERQEGAMTLRRGFSVAPGERVLLVEDVVTTGGSVRELQKVIETLGGTVVGIVSILDRSNGGAAFTVPFHPLLSLEVVSHSPGDCPLCREGIPETKPGSRPG